GRNGQYDVADAIFQDQLLQLGGSIDPNAAEFAPVKVGIVIQKTDDPMGAAKGLSELDSSFARAIDDDPLAVGSPLGGCGQEEPFRGETNANDDKGAYAEIYDGNRPGHHASPRHLRQKNQHHPGDSSHQHGL